MSETGSAKVPLVRKPLLISLVVVALLAGSFLPALKWYLLRTEYSPGFSDKAFEMLEPGDDLNSVLHRLNKPLEFFVYSRTNDESRYQEYLAGDLMALANLVEEDESVAIILCYSMPVYPGGDYRLRQVWIRNGKIQEIRSYDYWD